MVEILGLKWIYCQNFGFKVKICYHVDERSTFLKVLALKSINLSKKFQKFDLKIKSCPNLGFLMSKFQFFFGFWSKMVTILVLKVKVFQFLGKTMIDLVIIWFCVDSFDWDWLLTGFFGVSHEHVGELLLPVHGVHC